jgi:type VI secretion system secreted protein Hcp
LAKPEFPVANVISSLAPTFGSAPPAESSFEMHLNLTGIVGESLSASHLNEIELTSFSWGVSNSVVNAQNNTLKGGKVSMTEVTVTKAMDKASVLLLKASTTAQSIAKGVITWSKSTGGKRPEDFITITLMGVLVSSVHQTSARNIAGMGTETVTLSFQQVSVDYKSQGKDGLLTSAGSMSYSLAAGT